jgi:chemotaxis protein methyltransferase CheR
VNEDALQKARRGIYSAWSFRALPPELRERCFHRVAEGFELDAGLRRMVRFERDNLSDNVKGQTFITQDMDLILCRNVLIYFQPEAVGRAVTRFASSLREGGYLLTGHAELHHHNTAPLRIRTFPESIAYQCCESPQSRDSISVSRQIATSIPSSKPATKSLASPSISLRVTPPVAAREVRIQPASKSADLNSSVVEELCQTARTHANAGRHEEAVNCCKEAIVIDPVATDAYFIWAQVAQELGHLVEAKELYKKVIYLSPSHIEAHIELAAMYDLEADGARAHRLRLAALSALRGMTVDAHVEAITKHLERLVNEKSDGGHRV